MTAHDGVALDAAAVQSGVNNQQRVFKMRDLVDQPLLNDDQRVVDDNGAVVHLGCAQADVVIKTYFAGFDRFAGHGGDRPVAISRFGRQYPNRFRDGAPQIHSLGLEIQQQFWPGPARNAAGTQKAAARGGYINMRNAQPFAVH